MSSAVCTIRQPCHVSAPFAHIFATDVSPAGLISTTPRAIEKGKSIVLLCSKFQCV